MGIQISGELRHINIDPGVYKLLHSSDNGRYICLTLCPRYSDANVITATQLFERRMTKVAYKNFNNALEGYLKL